MSIGSILLSNRLSRISEYGNLLLNCIRLTICLCSGCASKNSPKFCFFINAEWSAAMSRATANGCSSSDPFSSNRSPKRGSSFDSETYQNLA